MVQDHWLRRIIAVVIDALIVSLAFGALAVIVAIPYFYSVGFPNPPAFPVWWVPWGTFGFDGVLIFLYFFLAEGLYGRTIGKELMGLRVEHLDGGPVDFRSSLIRNFSKIYWVLLLIDVAVGLGTVGEMSQKWSDRYVGTKVVETRVHSRIISDEIHL